MMLQLDSSLISATGGLPLLAESLVEGYMHGLHRSPYKGSSQEFCSYRPYMHGDPVKLVDWKLWARSDSYFVREFEEETNFSGYLFIDASRSMDFGEGAENKFTYARILSATLIMLMKKQKDAPGLAFFGVDEDWGPRWMPADSRQDHIENLIHILEGVAATGSLDNLGDVSGHLEEVRQRSVAMVISDGFSPPEDIRNLLEQLAIRGMDTVFFHLLCPEEVMPTFEGDIVLVDSETDKELPVDGMALREIYAEKLEKFLKEIEGICQDTETDYCKMITSEPLDEALSKYLDLRGKR